MLLKYLRLFAPTRALIVQGSKRRSLYFSKQLAPYLHTNQNILDIGVGTGGVTERLQDLGYDITGLDIQNYSFTEAITPIIYDGHHMPLDDKQFDTALILTVLHHTTNAEEILLEAKRVARQVIVLEDVYDTTFRRNVTYFFDSLFSLEFFGHPHSNRTDKQWRQTFAKLGLEIIATKSMHSFVVMQHQLYVLRSVS